MFFFFFFWIFQEMPFVCKICGKQLYTNVPYSHWRETTHTLGQPPTSWFCLGRVKSPYFLFLMFEYHFLFIVFSLPHLKNNTRKIHLLKGLVTPVWDSLFQIRIKLLWWQWRYMVLSRDLLHAIQRGGRNLYGFSWSVGGGVFLLVRPAFLRFPWLG